MQAQIAVPQLFEDTAGYTFEKLPFSKVKVLGGERDSDGLFFDWNRCTLLVVEAKNGAMMLSDQVRCACAALLMLTDQVAH